MATEKPTDDGARVVPLDLSIERRLILRKEIEVWRDGDREDLETPEKLADPDRTSRRVATYERLIGALSCGKIALPDEDARAALKSATDAFEEEAELGENNAIRDAQLALLSVLDTRGHESVDQLEIAAGAQQIARWTTRDDDLAMESAVLQRLSDVHPARLTEAELVRELIGEQGEFGHQDAVKRAVRDLCGVGLVHAADEFVTPTRAALRYRELLDR